MKKHILKFTLLISLLSTSFFAVGQDTLAIDKERIDKIIKEEINRMELKHKEGYKAGRVTWTFPEKVAKDELITVEIKYDGETFLCHDYDPVTYKFMGGIDLR